VSDPRCGRQLSAFIPAAAILPALISAFVCAVVVPAVIVSQSVSSRRFATACYASSVGWAVALFAMGGILGCTGSAQSGMAALLAWAAGTAFTVVTGFIAAVLGYLRDRRPSE
jgi:hypothetical protein